MMQTPEGALLRAVMAFHIAQRQPSGKACLKEWKTRFRVPVPSNVHKVGCKPWTDETEPRHLARRSLLHIRILRNASAHRVGVVRLIVEIEVTKRVIFIAGLA